MDWCPVEWPARPRPNLNNYNQQQQSGKKATKAFLLGLGVIIILLGIVLGYAVWIQKISITDKFAQTKGLIKQFISGQMQVNITVDGQTRQLQIKGKTVQDVLAQQGIKVGTQDRVLPALSTPIKSDMNIKVILVEQKQEIKEIPLAFVSKKTPTAHLLKGITKRVSSGQTGLARQTWSVRYEDGQEVSRVCLNDQVVRQPVDEVILIGTLGTISRGGQQLRFSRVMEMTATGYTHTGKNTASGVRPGPGVVAVDPRVIPLGTRLYVDGYGNAVALDTGGLIKGNRIDLFYGTKGEAQNWGVKRTKVYILE